MVRPDALNAVYEHAVACFPLECCGFIRASGEVYKAQNIQAELHTQDPSRFPRSAAGAFTFSPEDLRALSRGLADPDPPIVIYHSHPSVGAYFSEKDQGDALYCGQLRYPVDFLVVDVCEEGTRGAKLYRYVDRKFRCVWSDLCTPKHRAYVSNPGA